MRSKSFPSLTRLPGCWIISQQSQGGRREFWPKPPAGSTTVTVTVSVTYCRPHQAVCLDAHEGRTPSACTESAAKDAPILAILVESCPRPLTLPDGVETSADLRGCFRVSDFVEVERDVG